MTARVVLVGVPGVGKSTIGRALADVLSVGFADIDDLIADAAGQSAASLLRSQGESAFRTAEARALATALDDERAGVVATGGGAVETESSRALLAAARFVVQLTAPPEVVLGRLAGGDRPLLQAPSIERVTSLSERRAVLYAEVADAVVDATSPVSEVVSAILAIMVPA